MALAMIYPDPEKGGRGQNRKETLPFSKMRLSQARLVYRELPAVAALAMIYPEPKRGMHCLPQPAMPPRPPRSGQ
jgi:hypothetical protein